MKKDIIKAVIGTSILYVLHFLLFPLIFDVTNNKAGIVFFVSTIIISVIEIIFIIDKFRWLMLSDILYLVFAFLYHPPGAYGIGMVGLNLGPEAQSHYSKPDAFLGIIIATALLLFVQVLVYICFKIFNKFKSK